MTSVGSIHKNKLRIITLVFTLFSLATGLLLIRWEMIDSEPFLAYANSRFVEQKIPSVRGSILAADGSTLAYSEPRFDTYIYLPDLQSAEAKGQSRQDLIMAVSTVTGITVENITAKISSGAWWVKIAPTITAAQRDQLLANHFFGIQFQYTNLRVYPEGSLASQVLGYVSLDPDNPNGTFGLEQKWDGVLQPQEGVKANEVDSFGNVITLSDSTPIDARPGSTVVTTIDKKLQQVVQDQLKQGVTKYEAVSGSAILMDPKTGAIRAMANYPDFNPNTYFENNNSDAFGNKAITTPYEIGSVGKVFTVSAAFDLGKLTPDSVVLPNGHGGCEVISPNPPPTASCRKNQSYETTDKNKQTYDCICTYNGAPKSISMTAGRAFTDSDNIGLRHIALTMNYDEFYSYLKAFGVGDTTGVELQGESAGVIKQAKDWNFADQAVYAYGHSYSMTPLEAITAVNTIANKGIRMQPYIVSKVIDADNTETVFNPRAVVQVVKPQTADMTTGIMNDLYKTLITSNKYKHLNKYNIALKSGTALVPFTDRSGYSSQINATYVGFDASPARTFILLVKLERPKNGTLSVENARFVWLDTFDAIKDYLNVPTI